MAPRRFSIEVNKRAPQDPKMRNVLTARRCALAAAGTSRYSFDQLFPLALSIADTHDGDEQRITDGLRAAIDLADVTGYAPIVVLPKED